MGMIRKLKDRVHSISTKMAIAFFVASAVPLAIGFALIESGAHSRFDASTERQLVELATSTERLLNEHIDGIQSHANALAQHSSVEELLSCIKSETSIKDDVLISAARDVSATQSSTWGNTHHIFLVDTQGAVVLSPPKDGWQQPDLTIDQIQTSQSPHFSHSIADADIFQAGVDSPVLSDFFGFSERDHYHQLAIHPVKDDENKIVGFVVVEISIDAIQKHLDEQSALTETGHIYLTTETGQLVVHKKSQSTSQTPPSELLKIAIKNNALAYGQFKLGAKELQGVYLPSPAHPWVVCIEIDHEEINAPVLAQRHQFVMVVGSILALCALTALLVARVFGRPIKNLAASANAVAAGDLFRKINITSNDDIGQLQSAVDAMRSSLKNQIDRLDNTIVQRTVQLTQLNEQLIHDSDHDKLTGLASRDLLRRDLQRQLQMYHQDPSHLVSVLFFDFDRFKLVNDSLGHAAGDALLCSIADRFRDSLRESDLPARFGGDEFVVLLSPVESADHAMEAANRLLKLFETHHVLDGHEIVSTASIGLVTADTRYTTAQEMIRDADAAMYQAKLAGKNQVVRFDQKMLEDAHLRLKLEEDLHRAIENKQLQVAYQPIIGLGTMKPVGFEALIRWDHPELGWIGPDQFIPIAEDNGKIVKIGEWILEQSVHQLLEWGERFDSAEGLSVNVNVAKRQLMYAGFMPHLKNLLDTSGIDPKQLKIEITESTIVDPRSGMGDVINEIRALGVQIAMDDFGTGHSSLSMLHKFKFDVLKIDQSFIRDMELNVAIGAVLHAIIELAQNTGMDIVAEGVETESQVASLIAHGCDMVQGYYFAKPMFPKDVEEFLANTPTFRSAA